MESTVFYRLTFLFLDVFLKVLSHLLGWEKRGRKMHFKKGAFECGRYLGSVASVRAGYRFDRNDKSDNLINTGNNQPCLSVDFPTMANFHNMDGNCSIFQYTQDTVAPNPVSPMGTQISFQRFPKRSWIIAIQDTLLQIR